MNNHRRKQIQQIIQRPESQREDIESILSDEQEAFDNMPEGIQSSERGQAAEAAIEYLESASGYMINVIEELGCAIE